MRKILFDITTGLVINVVEIEDGANWQPPAGYAVVDAGLGGIGDTWDGVKFVKPPELTPPPDPAIAIAAAVSDVVAEIDKAFTVRTTRLTDTEKNTMRDKMVTLIARAQGRP